MGINQAIKGRRSCIYCLFNEGHLELALYPCSINTLISLIFTSSFMQQTTPFQLGFIPLFSWSIHLGASCDVTVCQREINTYICICRAVRKEDKIGDVKNASLRYAQGAIITDDAAFCRSSLAGLMAYGLWPLLPDFGVLVPRVGVGVSGAA